MPQRVTRSDDSAALSFDIGEFTLIMAPSRLSREELRDAMLSSAGATWPHIRRPLHTSGAATATAYLPGGADFAPLYAGPHFSLIVEALARLRARAG